MFRRSYRREGIYASIFVAALSYIVIDRLFSLYDSRYAILRELSLSAIKARRRCCNSYVTMLTHYNFWKIWYPAPRAVARLGSKMS